MGGAPAVPEGQLDRLAGADDEGLEREAQRVADHQSDVLGTVRRVEGWDGDARAGAAGRRRGPAGGRQGDASDKDDGCEPRAHRSVSLLVGRAVTHREGQRCPGCDIRLGAGAPRDALRFASPFPERSSALHARGSASRVGPRRSETEEDRDTALVRRPGPLLLARLPRLRRPRAGVCGARRPRALPERGQRPRPAAVRAQDLRGADGRHGGSVHGLRGVPRPCRAGPPQYAAHAQPREQRRRADRRAAGELRCGRHAGDPCGRQPAGPRRHGGRRECDKGRNSIRTCLRPSTWTTRRRLSASVSSEGRP